MKAYRLHSVNDLRYEDCELPQLKPNYVLIKVRACGICSSDVPRIFEKGTYHFPTTPGHEFSGTVVSVGENVDESYVGKRVSIFPLIPCKECAQCKNKHYEMCEHYDYLGSRSDGGFAEYVAAPVWNLIELPQSIGFDEGALFEPLAVALHCINQAEVTAEDSVAVIGSGAIAFAVGQWAKMRGAKQVYIVGRSNAKRQIAEGMGLLYLTTNDLENKLFDAVVEAVGTSVALQTAIEHTNATGRIVAMGNPAGDIVLPQNIYWRILRKQLKLIGTWNSVFDGTNMSEWLAVRDAVEQKTVNAKALITHRFSQDELKKGLDIMKNHLEPYCKIMTLWGEE